jgi:hypothetical protein
MHYEGTGERLDFSRSQPSTLFILHRTQLSLKNESGDYGSDRRYCCENSSRRDYYDSYLFAFAALFVIGMSFCAIGIYFVWYREKALGLGVLWEICGGILFLGSVGSFIGVLVTHGG